MTDYYKPCEELSICNDLISRYFEKGEYAPCFKGHLELAEKGYPLAECQVGYFYHEGLGVTPDPERALYWTQRAADHRGPGRPVQSGLVPRGRYPCSR